MPRLGATLLRSGPAIAIAACLTACATSGATVTATPATSASERASASVAGSPPTGIPSGLPVSPGAESDTPLPDEGVLARWVTDENGAQVYDFYVAALPAAGFEIEQLTPGGAVAVITFTTSDGQVLDLLLTEHNGGTQIDLAVPMP